MDTQLLIVILIITLSVLIAGRYILRTLKGDACQCDALKAQTCSKDGCPLRSIADMDILADGEAPVVSLNELKPGQKARIVRIEDDGSIYHRLLEMGVTPGVLVEVIRFAPMKDPMDIKIRGYHLLLRRKEAAAVSVEMVSV